MSEGKLNPYYLGINQSIDPSRLGDYEGLGYVLQEKYDGWWACLEVVDGGKIIMTTRRNNVIKDANIPPVPAHFKGTVLIGEWMPKTGIVWLHDIIREESEVLRLTTQQYRRYRLDKIMDVLGLGHKVSLAPQYDKGFAAVFESIVLDGGEGVVLKNEMSLYHTSLKTQKTGLWIKCKPVVDLSQPWVGGEHKWVDPDTMAVI